MNEQTAKQEPSSERTLADEIRLIAPLLLSIALETIGVSGLMMVFIRSPKLSFSESTIGVLILICTLLAVYASWLGISFFKNLAGSGPVVSTSAQTSKQKEVQKIMTLVFSMNAVFWIVFAGYLYLTRVLQLIPEVLQ